MFNKRPVLAFMGLCIFMMAIEGIFSFCGKKKCSGFLNPTYDDWFPYNTGRSTFFLSPSEKDSLFISYTNKTEPYETSGGFESKSCSSIGATIAGNTKTNIRLNIDAMDNGTFNINFNFGGLSINANAITDTGLASTGDAPKMASLFSGSINLNNKIYNNVQAIEVDTFSSKPLVYKVWLAKSRGIVAYQKRLGHTLFVLQ